MRNTEPLLTLQPGTKLEFGRAGDFEIIDEAGRGDRGIVYSARLTSQTQGTGVPQYFWGTDNPLAAIKVPYFALDNEVTPTGSPIQSDGGNTDADFGTFAEAETRAFTREYHQYCKLQRIEPIRPDETMAAIAKRRKFVLTVCVGHFWPNKLDENSRIPSTVAQVPIALQPYFKCQNLKEALDTWDKRNGEKDYEVLWILFEKLTEALESAHLHGLIHGDVRASNILVLGDLPDRSEEDFPDVLLTDFAAGGLRGAVAREKLGGLDLIECKDPSALSDQRDLRDRLLGLPEPARGDIEQFAGKQIVQLQDTSGDFQRFLELFQRDDEPFIQKILGNEKHNRVLDVASDIYMLGRLFLRVGLGLGRYDVPLDFLRRQELRETINNEVPDKPYIKELLHQRNEKFYKHNIAVADIISRCVWQPAHKGRYTRVSEVRRDLDVFRQCKDPARSVQNVIAKADGTLGSLGVLYSTVHTTFIRGLVDYQAKPLESFLQDWKENAMVEIYGGHNEMMNLWAYMFSEMERGDFYLSVTPRRFFDKEASGVDGRVFGAQILAAQAGVHIRRIHLKDVPDTHGTGPDLESVKKVHVGYLEMLGSMGVNVVSKEFSASSLARAIPEKGSFVAMEASCKNESVKRILKTSDYLGEMYETTDPGGLTGNEMFRVILGIKDQDGNHQFYFLRSIFVKGEGSRGNRLIGLRIWRPSDSRVAPNFLVAYGKLLKCENVRSWM